MDVQHAAIQQSVPIMAVAAMGLAVPISIILGLLAAHRKKPRS
jgi:ABC-type dipeptide/oligopeptide/nickel transport system permease subunit